HIPAKSRPRKSIWATFKATGDPFRRADSRDGDSLSPLGIRAVSFQAGTGNLVSAIARLAAQILTAANGLAMTPVIFSRCRDSQVRCSNRRRQGGRVSFPAIRDKVPG